MPDLHVHFETRRNKPSVFRITEALVADALAGRGLSGVRTSVGEDLASLDWLATASGLVSSNDLLRDPTFPLTTLAKAAPHLRSIHMTGAGIEPLLPLDWLPEGVTLTNNSGVHVRKTAEFAAMALLMLNARMPNIVTNQGRSRWAQIFTPSIAGKTVVVIKIGRAHV